MEPVTKVQLLERALVIQQETQIGANTADRVGGLLVDMITYLAANTSLAIKSLPVLTDINVVNGTLLANIGLPTTITATLINDEEKVFTVEWTEGTPAYDGAVAGTYPFIGTLVLELGYINPLSLSASINVIVAAA